MQLRGSTISYCLDRHAVFTLEDVESSYVLEDSFPSQTNYSKRLGIIVGGELVEVPMLKGRVRGGRLPVKFFPKRENAERLAKTINDLTKR